MKSLDSFELEGLGIVYVVAAPFDITDRSVMYGPQEIDGIMRTVVGVYSFAIPTIRAGIAIGLLVSGEPTP